MGKSCFIPGCYGSSDTGKVMVFVPKNPTRRRAWMEAVMIPTNAYSTCTNLYCCEDHFELEKDAENFMFFREACQKLRMKPNVVPHLAINSPLKIRRSQISSSAKKRKASLIKKPTLNQRHTPDHPAGGAKCPSRRKQVFVSRVDTDLDVHEESCTTEVLLEDKRMQTLQSDGRDSGISHDQESSTLQTSPLAVPLSPSPPLTRTNPLLTRFMESTQRKPSPSESDSSFVPSDTTASSPSKHVDTSYATATHVRLEHHKYLMHMESRFYLGLPKEHYRLIAAIEQHCNIIARNTMVVFKKIRTNDQHKRIGHDFGLDVSTVSKIFSSTIVRLSGILAHFIFWPSSRNIVLKMPIQFRYRFYNVESIIDAFEIEMEKPSSPREQALTWSDYKKCNTIKYLISCTPQGLINFISNGYGGRISDCKLVSVSSYLHVLPNNCQVLADRGFKQVERLLVSKNCQLTRPPSVSADEILSPAMLKWSKQISSVRIHIERVISRVREFSFLGPHARVDTKLVPLLDHAVTIACALINLQDPII